MDPSFSRLLIHEHVIQRFHPHPEATAFDLTMMVKVAGKERSEADWRTLLESAGFEILMIWGSPLSARSIIEAAVKNGPVYEPS